MRKYLFVYTNGEEEKELEHTKHLYDMSKRTIRKESEYGRFTELNLYILRDDGYLGYKKIFEGCYGIN